MHPTIEARAPKWRNHAAMLYWFDAWNADNERAREEYEKRNAEIDQQPIGRKRKVRGPHGLRTPMDLQKDIVDAYVNRQVSLKRTAAACGVSECAVRNVLRVHGIQTRGLSEAQRLRWAELRAG